MDHALEPHGQRAQRCWRADGERLVELARELHPKTPPFASEEERLEEAPVLAKRVLRGSGSMIDVLNLALPYFGLIFLGYGCGKLKNCPISGSPG
jgi:hypothetical protein